MANVKGILESGGVSGKFMIYDKVKWEKFWDKHLHSTYLLFYFTTVFLAFSLFWFKSQGILHGSSNRASTTIGEYFLIADSTSINIYKKNIHVFL